MVESTGGGDSSRSTIARRVVAASSLIAVGVLGFLTPVAATNYGSGGNVNAGNPAQETQISEQDDNFMVISFYYPERAGEFPYTFSGAQGLISNFVTMWSDSRPRDATFDGRGNYSCCFSGNWTEDRTAPRNAYSSQDVLIADGQYNVGGLLGWVDCDESEAVQGGANPNRFCRGSVLRLDYSGDTAGNYWVSNGRARVALCHELGHTIGLQHPNSALELPNITCMTNPLSTFQRWLTTHDHAHMDSNY